MMGKVLENQAKLFEKVTYLSKKMEGIGKQQEAMATHLGIENAVLKRHAHKTDVLKQRLHGTLKTMVSIGAMDEGLDPTNPKLGGLMKRRSSLVNGMSQSEAAVKENEGGVEGGEQACQPQPVAGWYLREQLPGLAYNVCVGWM